MKGLKKLALATAVAAAPFAQADLVAMDDSVLETMTGQAGVTIELSANVSVGSFVFTDTDGYVPSTVFTIEDASGTPNTAGTFSMNNIVLGGNGGGALDDIKIDIDIDGDDGLVIHLGGTNTGDVLSGGPEQVDFGLSIGSVDVNSTTLASNIAFNGILGPIDVVIDNAGVINVDAFFEVTSGGMDIDVLGMGLTNLTVGDDSAPIVTNATYNTAITAAQTFAVTANAAVITGAGDSAADAIAVGAGFADDAALQADTNPANDAARATATANRAGAVASATAAVEAGAIAGVSNMAYVGMTIQTADTTYFDLPTASNVTVQNALNITIDAMAMDITADVSLGDNGARELGSIAINDLDLSGTSLTIYGH